jgi:hypothetical protein
VSSHQVSGQMSIKKLTSYSTQIHLSGPSIDNYNDVTISSGMVLQANLNFVNSYPGPRGGDTIMRATYLNNILSIQNSGLILLDIDWNNINLSGGSGKFVNGKWEVIYQTSGVYTEIIASLPNNFLPFHELFFAYHTYHLTCVKQH